MYSYVRALTLTSGSVGNIEIQRPSVKYKYHASQLIKMRILEDAVFYGRCCFFYQKVLFFYKKVLFFIRRCCFTRTSLIRHWFVRSKAGDCHLSRVEITGAGERKITDCRVGWLQVWKPARLQFEPIVRLAWTSKQLLNCLVRAARNTLMPKRAP